jgi:hypothetical protein
MIIISLGAGVQSTALLIMSNLGLYNCPKADYAIFADTQAEPSYVYENLERLEKWSKIPVVRCTNGSLEQSMLNNVGHFASIPSFTNPSGMLRRQCTREYKINPIERKIKELLGIRKYCWVKEPVTVMIGISTDEISRVKPSRTRWTINAHPLIDANLRRSDCEKIITDVGLPIPMKSACVFCPYHDNKTWKYFKENHPDEWKRIVAVDEGIRDLHVKKVAGIKSQCFLHRSRIPMSEIDFSEQNYDLFESECEGHCGV